MSGTITYTWNGQRHRLVKITRTNVREWTRRSPRSFLPLRPGLDQLDIAGGAILARHRKAVFRR